MKVIIEKKLDNIKFPKIIKYDKLLLHIWYKIY